MTGGHGSVREIRLLSGGGCCIEGDGNTFHPPGLLGGLPGTTGDTVLNGGTPAERTLPPMSPYRKAAAGDVLRTVSPCGGGYGDPLVRDPQAVLDDVLDELTTVEAAHADYDVVVDAATWQVDVAETTQLRKQRVAAAAGRD